MQGKVLDVSRDVVTHILEMLTMLEKVSAFTEVSRVSKSHLGNENVLNIMLLPSMVWFPLRTLEVI